MVYLENMKAETEIIKKSARRQRKGGSMGGAIVSGVILGFCALIMFIIGISQYKSQKSVGFYTGEAAPKASEISDVKAWNHKHGWMWILYGICIVCAWVSGLVLGDSLWMLILFSVFLLVPIPFMILYHHHLIKRYFVKQYCEKTEE